MKKNPGYIIEEIKMNKVIEWLKNKHINHAAIVLLGMLPMSFIISLPIYILLGMPYNIAFNTGVIAAAFVWSFGYYMREVAVIQNRVGAIKALWPGNWLTFHDKIQTFYLVMTAIFMVYLLVRQ